MTAAVVRTLAATALTVAAIAACRPTSTTAAMTAQGGGGESAPGYEGVPGEGVADLPKLVSEWWPG